MGVKEQYGMLEDIPGIGPKIAEKLVGMGINTQEDVLNNVDDEILNSLPPRARTAIKEWQESQR
jgi:predicted flap endonuclease-1-like 5' DNA nuclease